jgi:hypothetical protein
MKGVVSSTILEGLVTLVAVAALLVACHATHAATTYIDADWTITSDTMLSDGTWVVNGSVDVEQGTLTLLNATLVLSGHGAGPGLRIEPSGTLVSNGSEVTGGGSVVVVVFEGSVAMDRTTVSGIASIKVLAGEVAMEGCRLHDGAILLDVIGGNVTLTHCALWNFTSTAIWANTTSLPTIPTRLRVEGCDFRSPLSSGNAIGMGGRYDEDIVSRCDMSVLNCTLDGGDQGGTALEVALIRGPMSLNFSGNQVSGHRYGAMIYRSGPEIILSNNTYIIPRDGVGIQLDYYGQSGLAAGGWPRIANETIRGTRDAIGVQAYARTDEPIVLSGLDITGCQWGIFATSGASIEVRDSRILEARGWDFVCNVGSIIILDCEHEYYGLVETGAGQIDEYQEVNISSVAWQNGHRLEEGLTVLENETGVVQATVDNAHPGRRTFHLWHVDATSSWLTTNVRATLWKDGIAFSSPYYLLKSRKELDIMLVDSVVPTVGIQWPAEDSASAVSDIEVRGTWTERGSGVKAITVHLDDGGPVEAAVGPDGTWNVTLPGVTDGAHGVSVNITDLAGNSAVAAVHRFVVDSTPPSVEILSPDRWVNRFPVWLIARTEPLSRVYVDLMPVDVLDDGMFTAELDLVEGENTVRIRVVDALGRQLDTTYVIHLDTVEPILVVESPIDGAWTAADPVLVEGQVQGAVEVEVNGQLVAVVGGRFSQAVQAPEGVLLVVVRATDLALNVAQVVRTVHVDREAPVLVSVSPTSGGATREGSIVLGGTVLDASPVTVTVGGTSVEATGGAWSAGVLLSEGLNELLIVARDAAGNVASRPFNVTKDTAAPQLTARLSVNGVGIGPGTDLYTRAIDAFLEITLDEECDVDVTGMGTMDLPDGTSTFIIPFLPGRNEITVWARDLLGNAAPEVRYNVTVDRVPPRLSIVQPREGARVHSENIILRIGTDEPCLATINGFQPLGGEAYGFEMSVELEAGRNTIHMMVEDRAGNRAYGTLNVTWLPEGGAASVGPDDTFLGACIGIIAVLLVLGMVLFMRVRRRPRTRATLKRLLELGGLGATASEGDGRDEPAEAPRVDWDVPSQKPPPPGAEGGEPLPPPGPMPWYPPGKKGIQPAPKEPAQGGSEEGDITLEGPGLIY